MLWIVYAINRQPQVQVMILNREIATIRLFTVLTLNHTEHIPSIQPEIPNANIRQIWNMCKTNLKVNDIENDIFGKNIEVMVFTIYCFQNLNLVPFGRLSQLCKQQVKSFRLDFNCSTEIFLSPDHPAHLNCKKD